MATTNFNFAKRKKRQAVTFDRLTFDEQKRQAVIDVATYRVVSVRDLADERFGGNDFTARKGIDSLKRKGFLEEDTVSLPSGKGFKVLTATEKGRQQACDSSPDTRQRYWSGPGHHRAMRLTAAVYRAARNEIRELERNGAKVKRIRLGYELKGQVAQMSERARARRGPAAAHKVKIAAAHAFGLPVVENGRVLYPNAQIEYEDARGDTGRVNVEVISNYSRKQDILPKAAAGFSMHANGRTAGRRLAAARDLAGG